MSITRLFESSAEPEDPCPEERRDTREEKLITVAALRAETPYADALETHRKSTPLNCQLMPRCIIRVLRLAIKCMSRMLRISLQIIFTRDASKSYRARTELRYLQVRRNFLCCCIS